MPASSIRFLALVLHCALILPLTLSSAFGQAGARQWVDRIDNSLATVAGGCAVDAQGNVYVTGARQLTPGALYTNTSEYLTVKYDPDGTRLWEAVYTPKTPGQYLTSAIALDAAGGVYVMGNAGTLKYTTDGRRVWLKRSLYGNTGLALDANGGIYALSDSNYLSATGTDIEAFRISKYRASDGKMIWSRRYDGPGHLGARPAALAVLPSGGVCVTGVAFAQNAAQTGESFFTTVRYDTNGDLLWHRTYQGRPLAGDAASAIAVDAAGNVLVTGASSGPNATSSDGTWQYATVKYGPAGEQLWVRRFANPFGADATPYAIAIDNANAVLVAGTLHATSGAYLFGTVKYDSDGKRVWARDYSYFGAGMPNRGAWPWRIASDAQDNVIVMGQAEGPTGDLGYTTVKYDADGHRLWARHYVGETGWDDDPIALAVDPAGNVIVTGDSYGDEAYADLVTIKYSP